jgi:hypothetical protein
VEVESPPPQEVRNADKPMKTAHTAKKNFPERIRISFPQAEFPPGLW